MVYMKPKGRIVSKGFPLEDYSNNLNCLWRIWAPQGFGIILEFNLLYLTDIGRFLIGQNLRGY